jgi:hypothetical protein
VGLWHTGERGSRGGLFHVIDPHNPSDTMLAASLACFSQIEKDPWGPIDAMARRISCADQAEQPLILQRSIRERRWRSQYRTRYVTRRRAGT